jgi:transposase
MTLPGDNMIVAATFVAAVGDIRRFPERRKLTASLGLDPRVRYRWRGRNSARRAAVACRASALRPRCRLARRRPSAVSHA